MPYEQVRVMGIEIVKVVTKNKIKLSFRQIRSNSIGILALVVRNV
jgi:hypothetical protein